MIRGLVVGKFAPLHKGHELLVQCAVLQCDELLILSYTSQALKGCDAQRRRRWLNTSFPDCKVVVLDEGTPMPNDAAGDEPQRSYVAGLLRGLDYFPDRVFSSEPYGPGFAEHLSVSTGRSVTHVAVDLTRERCPTSATLIRSDIHGHRHWLPAHVYADFVRRAALLGAESTGKSSLGAWLATQLQTKFAAEFGREVWVARQGRLTQNDLLLIAQGQVAREHELLTDANRWLICDTTPLTTLFYSQATFGSAEPLLIDLADRPYHCSFLMSPDFPMVQDGTRQGESFRQRQHDWYLRELSDRDIAYQIISGSIEARKAALMASLLSADT